MTHSSTEIEAIQNVVNHVAAYQDGAPEATVAEELRRGLAEAEVELSDAEVSALTEAIEANGGDVDADSVLS